MSSGTHIVYAWITYFLAFCGISEFYFDIRQGRIIKSCVLRIHCRLTCLFIFFYFCTRMLCSWQEFKLFTTQSKLMAVLIVGRPGIMWITLVSCILCVQMRQQRIFEMIRNLLRIDEFIAESNCCANQSEKLYLLRLFWIKICLLVIQTTILFVWIFTAYQEFIFAFSMKGAICILRGSYFLLFNIIWQICNNFVKLQSYLEHLYIDPMPTSRKVQKVLEAHRMYYKVIRMMNDTREIFKYPLSFYLLQLIFNNCISGYSFCRMMLGNPFDVNSQISEWLLMFLCLFSLFEFYILTSVANMASRLHDETFIILRYSNIDSDLIERSVCTLFTLYVIMLTISFSLSRRIPG